MPISKAQQKAVTKYVKAKYDRFGLTMAKGRLDEIKTAAAAQGESVNAYINTAIAQRMDHDAGTPAGGPQALAGAPAGAGVVSLSSETIKAAQEAAQSAGETVPQFIERAVETQAKRDAVDRKMEGGKSNE